MGSELLLSYVIPFYNVENYIIQCVESLYNQDIATDSFEIILVNDCSLDSSKDKILELLKLHSNIKLIEHATNKKQGGARNTGVEFAQGKYIWFIDSDDYVKPHTVKQLIDTAIKSDLDILHFDYTRVYENGKCELYLTNYTTNIVNGNSFFFDRNEVWWKKSIEVWRRLHKKSFLLENQLVFDNEVFYEDFTYSMKVFNFAQRVLHIPVSPYCYRLNINSFTNATQSPDKLIETLKLIVRCLNLTEDKLLDKQYVPILSDFAKYQLDSVFDLIPYLTKKEKSDFFLKANALNLIKLIVILKWHEIFVFRVGNIKPLYQIGRIKKYLKSIKSQFKKLLFRFE